MWIDEYPHKVYVSVLILDRKVIDYKIGERCWKSPIDVTVRGQISYKDLFKPECETRYTFWEVNNSEEHQKVFDELAREWIKEQENINVA